MTHYDVLVLNSSFYSWSKSDGIFLDLGSSKKIHQEPVQPWMGLLNKQKGTLTVCGGWAQSWGGPRGTISQGKEKPHGQVYAL